MVEQTFDLADCSRRRYVSTRGLRVEFALISVVLASTGVGLLVYQFAHGTVVSGFRTLYGIPYYLLFGAALYLGWGSTKFAPGATLLVVGDDEVSFSFPYRGNYVLCWTDHHFRLDLVDARSSRLAQKYGIAGYARLSNHPSTRLTSEALDALITKAREHHLAVSVRERGGRWSIAGPLHTWVQIRAHDSRSPRPV